MKSILVPTDFSDNARNAFDYAVKLFGIDGVRYTLLNSFETPNAGSSGMLVSIDEMLEKESIADLEKELEYLNNKYKGITIDTESRHGSVDDVVAHWSNQNDVDAVVMGTTGASGLKKTFLGSNAQKVIADSEYPVFSVPEGFLFSPIKKIVFAADLQDISDNAVFDTVKSLAKKYNAHLFITHVVKSGDLGETLEEEKNRLKINQTLEGVDFGFHSLHDDNIVEAIDEFIEEVNADLLVVVPRKVTFWNKLFRKSISKEISYHTKVPLLAVKDQ
jgi:nucleotide-binding universal stress UspA family protein